MNMYASIIALALVALVSANPELNCNPVGNGEICVNPDCPNPSCTTDDDCCPGIICRPQPVPSCPTANFPIEVKKQCCNVNGEVVTSPCYCCNDYLNMPGKFFLCVRFPDQCDGTCEPLPTPPKPSHHGGPKYDDDEYSKLSVKGSTSSRSTSSRSAPSSRSAASSRSAGPSRRAAPSTRSANGKRIQQGVRAPPKRTAGSKPVRKTPPARKAGAKKAVAKKAGAKKAGSRSGSTRSQARAQESEETSAGESEEEETRGMTDTWWD